MFVSILSSGKTQPQREVIDLHAVFFAFFCLFGLVWFIVYSFSFLSHFGPLRKRRIPKKEYLFGLILAPSKTS